MTVTKHDRTLEERKWADEVDLRRAELDIRRKETNWLSKFFSPLTTTLLAGILTLAASAIGALIQGNNGLTLEREKFVSSKELETQKQQHELLLKMIAVPDQSQAKANLQFLAESGLIDDALAKKIQASASKSTPLLPPPQLTMAPGRIDVVYETPKNAAYQVVYDRMKSRRVLEEISLFLGSLKLPRKILLKMSDCEFADPSYDSSNATVTVCYALFDLLARLAPEASPDFKRDDVISGAAALVMRGTSRALIDVLNVPLSAPPESATSFFTEFVLLQFGSVAKRLLNQTASVVQALKDPPPGILGLRAAINERRLEDYICLAYGGDENGFRDFVDRKLLSGDRAGTCAAVCNEVRTAFVNEVLPFVDRDALQKIKAQDWLAPP